MDLLWPGFLLLLGLIPLLVAVYVWMLRRRRRFAVRYSSLALVREALTRPSRLRRHLPFALFLLALAGLVIALTRPVASLSTPRSRTTIILAMDVSVSMCATDIQPSRLKAAQAAALSFIQRQEPTTQIGIVAFAGFAELIQSPTTDQEALQAAIESLSIAPATAIGSAILESLDAIAEIDENVAPSVAGGSRRGEPSTAPAGDYAPAIIVLLTDGERTAGPSPVEAAQQAVERGVRVYTIGFGTENENRTIPKCGEQFLGDGPFGGARASTRWIGLGIDEPTLKRIAAMTGGTYYPATSTSELQSVFENLPTYVATRPETTEISVAFTALGALLAALAIFLALIWHPLP
jgi:Ca-activated chloride channel family protein